MNRAQGTAIDVVRAWVTTTSQEIGAALDVLAMSVNTGESKDMDAAITCASAVLHACCKRLDAADRHLSPLTIGESA